MGKHSGIIKFNGKTGSYVSYKLGDKHIIRSHDGQQGERNRSSPKYKNLRKAQNSFSLASQVGKLMRQALGNWCKHYQDMYVSGNLTGRLNDIIKKDSLPQGEKRLRAELLNQLEGFCWHQKKQPTVDELHPLRLEQEGNVLHFRMEGASPSRFYHIMMVALPTLITNDTIPESLAMVDFDLVDAMEVEIAPNMVYLILVGIGTKTDYEKREKLVVWRVVVK